MSICIALGMILSRSIHALDIKKRRETQKREQQRLSEQSQAHGPARQPSIQSGREYQYIGGGHEHPGEEVLRDSDHTHRYDGRNNSLAHRTVVPSPLQTFNWQDTEVVVGPLEDTPPMYDHNAARLPPYDHGSFPCRGRRQREGGRRAHCEVPVARNRAQINEPREARACTGMRIRDHPGLDVNQGEAMIWYDALEDRYGVISRSLAPPPYMPNRCVEHIG